MRSANVVWVNPSATASRTEVVAVTTKLNANVRGNSDETDPCLDTLSPSGRDAPPGVWRTRHALTPSQDPSELGSYLRLLQYTQQAVLRPPGRPSRLRPRRWVHPMSRHYEGARPVVPSSLRDDTKTDTSLRHPGLTPKHGLRLESGTITGQGPGGGEKGHWAGNTVVA